MVRVAEVPTVSTQLLVFCVKLILSSQCDYTCAEHYYYHTGGKNRMKNQRVRGRGGMRGRGGRGGGGGGGGGGRGRGRGKMGGEDDGDGMYDDMEVGVISIIILY